MYAVLETGGKQYRVSAGDTLEVERIAAEAGQSVRLDRVLLVNNDGKVSVGPRLSRGLRSPRMSLNTSEVKKR